MKTSYENGRIVARGCCYENAFYDMANNAIAVQADGKGIITGYAVVGDKRYFDGLYPFLKILIGGKQLPLHAPKTVEMIGRMQTVTIRTDDAEIVIRTFLDELEPCVFERISVRTDSEQTVEVAMLLPDGLIEHLQLLGSEPYALVPENFSAVFSLPAGRSTELKLVYGFGTPLDEHLCRDFDRYEKKAEAEIAAVCLPDSVKTELDKALYYSAYFCALQNYKHIGDFKAFTAGCHYISPARSYYRDSYFTVLPMYSGHTDKVRSQIITLARGIEPDGKCPSAVISDFSAWWGEHYDSPSMFCIETYDYVNNTGDRSVLAEKIGSYTVLELVEKALLKLSENCDGTGLLVKPGRFNKRDWADEVNRYGYVTYDQLLYARALYCFARLVSATDPEKARACDAQYAAVREAINTHLWSDELGYYVNFKNSDYTETNLSVDTVLAVIFGIADDRRSRLLLDSCQRLLDSRSNPDVEDFGILSVYPLYSGISSASKKSSRPMDYHNGADWPYWSAMYAYALKSCGREYEYPLTRWFDYNAQKGNYTPIEYYSPYCRDGSLLQGWSGAAAFVYADPECTFFQNKL